MKLALFLLFVVCATASAESYELKNLRPVSVSHYAATAPVSHRQYLRFENEQGAHTLVYDEVLGIVPLKEIVSLQQSMWAGACIMNVECTAKAFCTSDCKNMYYEMTNGGAEPQLAAKNKCKVRSFSCGARGGQR